MDSRDSHSLDPRIETFLQQSTEGLKADPELCLQTQRELRSHLDARLTENASQSDPVKAALKAMGSSLEIAGPLQKENAGRMKTRALVQLGIRTLLLPAALILTGWLVWIAAEKALALRVITYERALNPFARKPSGLSETDRLILYGDESKSDPAERFKAVWSRFPDDPVFFAIYVLRVHTAGVRPLESIPGFDQANTIDPDNALYSWLIASEAARDAFEMEFEDSGVRIKNILNPAAAEKFRWAVRKATAAPMFTTHGGELARRRLEILMQLHEDSIENRAEQYSAVVDSFHHFSVGMRELAKVLIGYANTLKNNDQREESTEMVRAVFSLFDHQVEDSSNTMIDWVATMALANLIELEVRSLMDDLPLDQTDHAAYAKIEAASQATTEKLDGQRHVPFLEETATRGGIMALGTSGLSTGLVWDSEIGFNLEPGRWLDYILLERVSLAVFLGILLFASAICYVRYIWNRWRSAERSSGHCSIPLLLVPSGKEIAKVLGFSLVLPLAGYLIYSRLTPLAGRDLNAMTQFWRFVAEQAVLWTVMIGIAGWLTRKLVAARFSMLGLSRSNSPAFYRATLMRSVAPIFIALALAMAIAAHPYLKMKEAHYLRADTMMSIDLEPGFSQFESKMVNAIRDTILPKGD